MTERLQDLRIDGNGSSNGGEFARVSINGNGKIYGDLVCEDFVCNGRGKVEGAVKAGRLSVDGFGTINGNIEAETVDIDGHATLNGNVETNRVDVDGHSTITGSVVTSSFDVDGWITIRKDITAEQAGIDGKCKIEGTFKAKDIKVNGDLAVKGDCESEMFKGDGRFNIDGLLSADQVNVRLFWDSSAREIGGQSVVVKKDVQGFTKFVNVFKTIQMVAESIEADYVELSDTKAKIVRGKDVVLLDGCDIELVEYTGTFEKTNSARVKKVVQL